MRGRAAGGRSAGVGEGRGVAEVSRESPYGGPPRAAPRLLRFSRGLGLIPRCLPRLCLLPLPPRGPRFERGGSYASRCGVGGKAGVAVAVESRLCPPAREWCPAGLPRVVTANTWVFCYWKRACCADVPAESLLLPGAVRAAGLPVLSPFPAGEAGGSPVEVLRGQSRGRG